MGRETTRFLTTKLYIIRMFTAHYRKQGFKLVYSLNKKKI